MPTTDEPDRQPAVDAQPQGPEPVQEPATPCAASDLRDTLQHIAGQIGDADRRHRDALEGMQERLGQLARQVDQVRTGLPVQHAGALQRIEDGVGMLAARIADFDRVRQAAAPTPADPDEPWDAESAEALTRVYEQAEAELQASPPPPRPRRKPAEATAESASDRDRPWLEARFADIAALLQSSLAESNPDATLAVLNRRLDQFEERLDSALKSAALHSDDQGLGLIEAHVDQLAAYFEHTRSQLARLDAIDQQLREMAQALQAQRGQLPAGAAGLGDADIETLIETAVERAASRVAAASPPAADEPSHQERIEALEGVLQDYIAERRRGEEVTSSVLNTIEDAIVRIADRVDAMETAEAPQLGDDGDAESERLAEAYAAGARVLGHAPVDAALDATDYAPTGQPGAQAGDPLGHASASAAAPPETALAQEAQTRQELRASALRAKLKAQARPGEPATESDGPDEARLGTARRARAQGSTAAAGPRFGLLLAAAMTLLFGAGYLVVDVLLMPAPAPAGVVQESVSETQASTTEKTRQGAAEPQPAGEAIQRAGGQQVVPPPQPAQRRPAAERVTDDGGRAQGPATRRGGALAWAFGASPAALSMEAAPLPGEPDGASLGGLEAPPAAIGTAALRHAAMGGEPTAEYEIAGRFADGKGVAQDQKLAFAWYRRAAMRGHAPAQFRLAAYLERGIGVGADVERAKVWYRRAAEQGHIKAMHNLGVLTIGNDNSRADYEAAARWFREAAERGLPDSQYNLGVLCEQGRGVARNLPEAYLWFALAARRGDQTSMRRLEQVKARLEPAELAAAEQTVAQWRARPAEASTSEARPAGSDDASR